MTHRSISLDNKWEKRSPSELEFACKWNFSSFLVILLSLHQPKQNSLKITSNICCFKKNNYWLVVLGKWTYGLKLQLVCCALWVRVCRCFLTSLIRAVCHCDITCEPLRKESWGYRTIANFTMQNMNYIWKYAGNVENTHHIKYYRK